MKIISFIHVNQEKQGVILDDGVKELSCSVTEALNAPDIQDFLGDGKIYDLSEIQILPPVRPSKVVCVGLNYRDHARELDMEIPDKPIIFIKPPTTVIGHLGAIIYPPSSKEVDYEAELGVVISKKARSIEEVDAHQYIGGYTVLNDVTARDLQRKDTQWTRAKSFDTFCPLGPCIDTELDPLNQKISLKLNDEVRQDSNTKNMIFSPTRLVDFISNIMTLYPGDVIATGTPPGVGSMNVGDVVETGIEDVGVLKNFVKNPK